MKLGKNAGEIEWMDDDRVDISKKKRVYRQSYISGEYVLFSPEDLRVETVNLDINPSIDKKSYKLSDKFKPFLNNKEHMLNRGWFGRTGVSPAFLGDEPEMTREDSDEY